VIALELAAPVLSAALWYLFSGAEITRWLWSRYPRWLEKFMVCPACSGTWYGAGWAATLGYGFGWTWFGVEAPLSIPLVALWCMALVPLVSWAQYKAMTALALPEEEVPPPQALSEAESSTFSTIQCRCPCKDHPNQGGCGCPCVNHPQAAHPFLRDSLKPQTQAQTNVFLEKALQRMHDKFR
jgi:hypothetical protein